MTVEDLDFEFPSGESMAARLEVDVVLVRKSPKYFPARRFPSPSRTRIASTLGRSGGSTFNGWKSDWFVRLN